MGDRRGSVIPLLDKLVNTWESDVKLCVHSNQFIVQELAPFPIFGGLLARHRACLSALLYKSIPYRFDDANVE